MTPEQETFLRRLALGDAAVTVATFDASLEAAQPLGVDPTTFALTRVAALIATDAPLATYQWAVEAAFAAGASDADLVEVLVAIAPIVGSARLTAAAPELALALGYDVAQAEPAAD